MHCFIILNLCALSDTCFCFSVKQKKTTIQILFIMNNSASMVTANPTCEKANVKSSVENKKLIVETSLFYVAFM